jgi:hypothetical protein
MTVRLRHWVRGELRINSLAACTGNTHHRNSKLNITETLQPVGVLFVLEALLGV